MVRVELGMCDSAVTLRFVGSRARERESISCASRIRSWLVESTLASACSLAWARRCIL